MLRPIFDQKTRRDGWMAPELRWALEWWIEVLSPVGLPPPSPPPYAAALPEAQLCEPAVMFLSEVLESGLCERREWNAEQRPPVHMFCDASGAPAHLGAVLFDDDNCFVTHYAPPAEILAQFRRRRDNQIMGLELLSISLGLCTFEHLIRGRNVIVHSDNTGSEACRLRVCLLIGMFSMLSRFRRRSDVGPQSRWTMHSWYMLNGLKLLSRGWRFTLDG